MKKKESEVEWSRQSWFESCEAQKSDDQWPSVRLSFFIRRATDSLQNPAVSNRCLKAENDQCGISYSSTFFPPRSFGVPGAFGISVFSLALENDFLECSLPFFFYGCFGLMHGLRAKEPIVRVVCPRVVGGPVFNQQGILCFQKLRVWVLGRSRRLFVVHAYSLNEKRNSCHGWGKLRREFFELMIHP